MKHTRWYSFCLAAVLICTLIHPAAAVSLTVDGHTAAVACYVENGTTYAALRPLVASLDGWELLWDNASKTAHARKNGRTLSVSLSAQTLTADGATLSLPVRLHDGALYVPLRAACSLIGYCTSWNAAARSIAITPAAPAAYTDDDLYWLSRIISAESDGESLTGQVAVGNVVVNRVASPDYPNSIYAVIFDRRDATQFTPVANGTIHNSPTESALRAAHLVLNGTSVVGDCLYFYNPNLTAGTWIRSNSAYAMTIGHHRFYYKK